MKVDVIGGYLTACVAFMCLVASIALGIDGCKLANGQYYAAQKNCVDAGGSWVPVVGGDAACIAGRK